MADKPDLDFAGELVRLRSDIGSVATALRPLSRGEPVPAPYDPALLIVYAPEHRLLLDVANGAAHRDGWRGDVLDSILLAVMWCSLRSSRPSADRDAPAGDSAVRSFQRLVHDMGARLEQRTGRVEATDETITRLMERARERQRLVAEEVSYARFLEGSREVVAAPPEVPSAPAPVRSPSNERSAKLHDFLAATIQDLRHLAESGDAKSWSKLTLDFPEGPAPALTEAEARSALDTDLKEDEPEAAEAELLRMTGALTLKIGADLDLLRAPGPSFPAGAAVPIAEQAADLDALEMVAELSRDVQQFARTQGRTRFARTLEPITRRLDRLLEILTLSVGADRQHFLKRAFETGRVPASSSITTGTARARATTRQIAPREETSPDRAYVRAVWAKLAACAVLFGAIAGYGVRTLRPYWTVPAPVAITSESIRPFVLPGAKLLEVSPPAASERMVRIETGLDFSHLAPAEQRSRLGQLCAFLATSGYERSEIVDDVKHPFARWESGRVTFEADLREAESTR